MALRVRVTELRWVRAGDLRPHPRNWRTHPEFQRQALGAVLAEVGFADALVARELTDGALELIDGHLRAEILPDERLPVLIVDVDEREADKLLASLDPLSALAECNVQAVNELLERVATDSEQLQSVLDDLRRAAPQNGGDAARGASSAASQQSPDLPAVDECFQLVVECRDELDQQQLYERLAGEGYRCRVLTL